MVAPQHSYPPHRPPSSSPGTSKIVPVVVSAGLAVGVFAGLLFGLGTGEDAQASRRARSGSGSAAPTIDVSSDEEFEETVKVAVVTPDAGPGDAGPGSGSDGGGSQHSAIKVAHVTFAVMPPGAPAKITVDGKPVETEAEIDISAGPKTVELVVKAPGFRDFKKNVAISQDDALTVELVKRPSGNTSSGTGTPTPRPPKKKSDKIDI
jgi:hypothetical protein